MTDPQELENFAQIQIQRGGDDEPAAAPMFSQLAEPRSTQMMTQSSRPGGPAASSSDRFSQALRMADKGGAPQASSSSSAASGQQQSKIESFLKPSPRPSSRNQPATVTSSNEYDALFDDDDDDLQHIPFSSSSSSSTFAGSANQSRGPGQGPGTTSAAPSAARPGSSSQLDGDASRRRDASHSVKLFTFQGSP